MGSGLDERPENENLEGFSGKDDLEMGDTLIREEETENVGIEDHVLVSDSSSEGREDEEKENDGIEETSLPLPAEEETTYEAGDRNVPPPPVVDSLVPISTRVEDPTAAATKGPVDQDSVPLCFTYVLFSSSFLFVVLIDPVVVRLDILLFYRQVVVLSGL